MLGRMRVRVFLDVEAVRELMAKHGIDSTAQLARDVGMSSPWRLQTALTEKGVRQPITPSLAKEVADVLGVEIDDIRGEPPSENGDGP